MRASLDASDVTEQINGLGVFDTNGKLHVGMGAYAVSEEGGGFYYYGQNGELRIGIHANESGGSFFLNNSDGKLRGGFGIDEEERQAGLSLSASRKDNYLKLAAVNDGNLYVMLSENDIPRATLALTEGKDKEPASELALLDKDRRSGVVVSSGRSSDPYVRLLDSRQRVRGSFALGVGGEPRLYLADEEGSPISTRGAFDGILADRGTLYQALFLAVVLVAGGAGGAWTESMASASYGLLPVALITVVVLTILVGLLIVLRQRG